MSNTSDKKVAFIGLGIMGSRMAGNLLKEGVDLTVYNRSTDKTEPLKKAGAKVANSIKECVEDADVVFTMLSTPAVVEEVAFGDEGFVENLKDNTLWVDSSTVDPSSASNLGIKAKDHGLRYLEAPVAGTKQPAEKGELVFFVGGTDEDVKYASPFFDIMGKKTVHLGEVGRGASIKMLINLMLAQSMLAFSETVKLGQAMGLDQQLINNILLNAPVTAPFLRVIQEKLESKETSANFPLKWMAKDLGLVAKAAEENNVDMPSAKVTNEIFQAAIEAYGDDDFSTIYHITQ
ncbi:MAG: NAD(P)-dependent oxidoreductase [Bacteroidota bacterium]